MLEMLTGPRFALIGSALILIVLFRLLLQFHETDLSFSFSLVLVTQLLVCPLAAGFNYLLAIPAVLFLLSRSNVQAIRRVTPRVS